MPAAAADKNTDKARTHTHTHSTLSIIHISPRVDADSGRVKLQAEHSQTSGCVHKDSRTARMESLFFCFMFCIAVLS